METDLIEYPNLETLVQALLAQGRKIEAVKQVRQATGWGLKESKDYVDALASGGDFSAFTEAPADYTAFSDTALLAALEYAGRAPHPELIHACLARQEALTPGLLDLLATEDDPDWGEDDPRWYRAIHAGLLLCAFREPAALPIFARLLPQEEKEAFFEWFDHALPGSYGPLAIPMLTSLLNIQGQYDYPAASACGMLAYIALHHPAERERVLAVLQERLPLLDDNGNQILTAQQHHDPPHLWSWIVNAFLDLRYTDENPRVKALFDAKLIDITIFGDWQAYLDGMAPDAPLPLEAAYVYDIIRDYELLHTLEREEAHRATPAALKPVAPLPLPPSPPLTPPAVSPFPTAPSFARQTPKVGRNDPCPCGSGKKYKRCCGQNQ